ncbi:MAG: peptidoglycan DD-metalloendopeptidase family protein, partial [Oscillospiraceae bacterium]
MTKKAQQIIAGILVVVLLLFAMASTLNKTAQAANVTQNDIQKIKDELSDIQAQKKEADAKLAAIRNDLSLAKEQMELIEDQVLFTEEEISASQLLLDKYDQQIGMKEQEIQELEIQEAEQLQEFYHQVRWLEETGGVSYLSILFEAKTFAEMLDYAMLITDIMDYSDRIIQKLENTQAELEIVHEALQTDRDAQAAVQQELEERKTELEEKKAEQNRVLQQIAVSESEYAKEAELLAQSEAQIDKELKEAERKYADYIAALQAQQKASGITINATSGNWYWPLPGRYYLSSLFGGRILYGVYDNHTGTDIPAPSGTPIYAANDGVVTTVNRNKDSSSYGYYCTINHGNGYVTLYAHQCQVPIVNEGDTVSKGQVIGYVGTTGISCGNHLHFELRVNGVRGNVLKLYPGLSFPYKSNGRTITIQGG